MNLNEMLVSMLIVAGLSTVYTSSASEVENNKVVQGPKVYEKEAITAYKKVLTDYMLEGEDMFRDDHRYTSELCNLIILDSIDCFNGSINEYEIKIVEKGSEMLVITDTCGGIGNLQWEFIDLSK